ncbi:aldehyde ferredoxin oxidoreductase family protein [Desulfobacula sp.]|uniref:aldehyde ferredoxin oxidoreductase family protein n=1 Tax=Desulfobacula sp. TaxID=2593537 RepID=UPI002615EA93|nr:aldehyde ferredoxin oxidoreductase family protein [Desulfobacula sp.]
MKGFFHKLLIADLTEKTFSVKEIDRDIIKSTLGGKGLATALLLKYNPPGVDPLGPDNHIIIAVGPATDSSIYGSCRHGIFCKSPLTSFYGESYSGGSLALPLSRTGFDAIIIKGASPEPVWLEIIEKNVFFHSAGEIWGKDTFETEEYIKKKSSASNCGVMVIGPAGENLVRFAVIKNDKWRVAGRTGMGAVMGSKKIKGISFFGEKKRPLADHEGIKIYNRNKLKLLKDNKATHAYRNLGTPMMVDVMNNAGAFPTKYWQKGKFDRIDDINAKAMAEKLNPVPHACKNCFMGCGKLTRVQDGRHKGLALEGPEYETIYAFGGLCMISDIREIAFLNSICDRLGIDTISSGNLAAFAIEASKQKKISDSLDYGSADSVADILHKIVRREGIGELLADGIKSAGEKLGMEDFTIHVKGMEPAGYDPRILKGMGLAYAVSDRGACHLRSTFYKAEISGMIAPEKIEGKAELFKDFEDRCTLFDSLIICRFYRDFYTWDELSKIVSLTTGIDMNKEELEKIAALITDNTRRFNIQEGLTFNDDTLPPRLFDQNLEQGKGITRDDLNTMVKDYYRVRGWDDKGIPQKK